jgi:hypothetical protein
MGRPFLFLAPIICAGFALNAPFTVRRFRVIASVAVA